MVVKIILTKEYRQGYAPYILYSNRNIVFKGSSKQLGDWFAHEETLQKKFIAMAPAMIAFRTGGNPQLIKQMEIQR